MNIVPSLHRQGVELFIEGPEATMEDSYREYLSQTDIHEEAPITLGEYRHMEHGMFKESLCLCVWGLCRSAPKSSEGSQGASAFPADVDFSIRREGADYRVTLSLPSGVHGEGAQDLLSEVAAGAQAHLQEEGFATYYARFPKSNEATPGRTPSSFDGAPMLCP